MILFGEFCSLEVLMQSLLLIFFPSKLFLEMKIVFGLSLFCPPRVEKASPEDLVVCV